MSFYDERGSVVVRNPPKVARREMWVRAMKDPSSGRGLITKQKTTHISQKFKTSTWKVKKFPLLARPKLSSPSKNKLPPVGGKKKHRSERKDKVLSMDKIFWVGEFGGKKEPEQLHERRSTGCGEA